MSAAKNTNIKEKPVRKTITKTTKTTVKATKAAKATAKVTTPIASGPSADQYDYIDNPIDYVLHRPNSSVGSVKQIPWDAFVFDNPTGKIKSRKITVPAGLERIFLEPFCNALDNVTNSRKYGVDPGHI